MNKGGLEIDPRGLIYESYRMDGVSAGECRAIFLDWALGLPATSDMHAALATLEAQYARAAPAHPMSALIREGLARQAETGRRRPRARRD